ncbi:MAG: dockerin type I repeat-containing protein [Bacteroidota bacterium]
MDESDIFTQTMKCNNMQGITYGLFRYSLGFLLLFFLPFLVVSQSMTIPIVEEGNPFLEGFFVSEYVGTDTLSTNRVLNNRDFRRTAEAYCHPQSPFRGNPLYKERLFFLLDTIMYAGRSTISTWDEQDIPFGYGLIKENFPEEIPADLAIRCDTILRNTSLNYFDFTQETWNPITQLRSWYNGQANGLSSIYLIGVALDNDTIRDIGESFFRYSFTDSLIQDNGAIDYTGLQNDVYTYRGFSLKALGTYYLVSQNQEYLKLWRKMIPYIPLSTYRGPTGQPMGEYYTAAFWKPYWNMSGPGGIYAQAALTNDPYNMDFAKANKSFVNAYYYRQNLVEPVDQPEPNYTIYDANILGPRGRYGDFGFAATSRVVDNYPNHLSSGERIGVGVGGKKTLVGAHVIKESGGSFIYNAAIDKVGLEVKISPGQETGIRRYKYRFLTTNERSSTTNSKQLYGLTSTYNPSHRFQPTDWVIHEQWVFMPERVVGHLTVNSLIDNQEAYAIGSIVKTVSGRNWWGVKRDMVDHGNGHYSYGRIHFIIRQQNLGGAIITEYAPMYGETVPDISEKSMYHRILDANNKEGVAEQEFSYNIADKFYYVIEIFEEGTEPAALISSSREKDYHKLVVDDGKREITSIMNIASDTLVYRDSISSEYTLSAALRSWHPDQALLKERQVYDHSIPGNNSILLIHSDDSVDVDVVENYYPDIFPASNYCMVGSACDDGNPCTYNDVYTEDCECVGTVDISLDTDGDGTCDYGDLTEGDCKYESFCDDGDPCTINDKYDAFCNCKGTSQDVDQDGICAGLDCDDNDAEIGQIQTVGAVCDDGDSTTVNDEIQEDGCTCLGGNPIALSIRLFLEGPYDAASGLMHDSLRQRGLLPLEDPYGLGEIVNPILLEGEGPNGLVDWVKVEIRDRIDPGIIHTTEAMLLQRDGDLMTAKGEAFMPVVHHGSDSSYLTVSHRNHLSLTTEKPILLADTASVDFSLGETAIHGGQNAGNLVGDTRLLVAGDANGDGVIDEIDRDQYWREENGKRIFDTSAKADVNLDGAVNVMDKNSYWRENQGKMESIPK